MRAVLPLCLLFVSVTASQLQAQATQFIVRGRVVERGDERPIPGATVTLGEAGAQVTDDQGSFIIRNVRPGRHPLVIEALGYETVRTTVVVLGEENATIRLNRRPVPLPPVDVRPRTFTLSGHVIDRATRRSVPFVTVRLD